MDEGKLEQYPPIPPQQKIPKKQEFSPQKETPPLHFDILIVFGQGPIKPLLLEEELTEDQRKRWEEFKKRREESQKGLYDTTELDFRVIEGVYRRKLDGIKNNPKLSDEERNQEILKFRKELQHNGKLALNYWGRMNALAAGIALVEGMVDKVILSGGKTRPSWADNKLPEKIIEDWPSEAELMKDIILRRFTGIYARRHFPELYFKEKEEALKKAREELEQKIIIEDASTNTLENLAYTINNNPDLIKKGSIALLGTNFHIPRIEEIAKRFGISPASYGKLSAQDVLKHRAITRGKKAYEQWLENIANSLENPDYRRRMEAELRWFWGLVDPKYISYWVGYFGNVENPKLTLQVLKALANDSVWEESLQKIFEKVGIDWQHYKSNIDNLSEQEIERLKQALIKIKNEHREKPPDLKEIAKAQTGN